MNPVFSAASQAAQLGWVMGLTTLLFMTCFVGWTVWAWRPSKRADMEAAAHLPFDDGAAR